MKKHLSQTRRGFLGASVKIGAVALAAPYISVPDIARAANSVTVVGFGGSTEEFQRKYWIEPFTKETGIEVVYVAGPDLAKVKAQVMSKNVEWDAIDCTGPMAYAGSKEKLWEEIDTNIVDMNRFVRKPEPDMVPENMWSGGIVYDPKRTQGAAKTFKDLWDVKNFPGRRTLRARAPETFEMALIADGVSPDKLYPLDLDRAFKSLDRIKPEVRKWYEQTAQGVSLLQTNEVDYSYTYVNRVISAQAAGISMDMSFEQQLVATTYCTVLRGSPRKEAAFRYCEFITRPEVQQVAAEQLSLIPATKGVFEKVSPEARKWLADTTNPKNIFINDEYWRDHLVDAEKRFKEWIYI